MELINQLGYIRETVRGMSQEQLARVAHISRRTISEIELNRRIPSVKTALIIAKALKCSVEDIFMLKQSRGGDKHDRETKGRNNKDC